MACAASPLLLSYDNQTTTNPHNPLFLQQVVLNASVAHQAVTQYVRYI